MPKDPRNVTQTPSGGAPSGDGFFDKESAVPPTEARIPEPPVVGATPPGTPALVRIDPSTQTPVAGTSAPDLQPAPAGPELPVLRQVVASEQLPEGGSYETDQGVAVLVKHLVVEPEIDDAEALRIAQGIRKRYAASPANLETLTRGIREALDGKRTPEEWARELGHVDATAPVADGEDGTPGERRGALRRRPIREAKGWVFAAVKRYAGWGTKHPIDVRLTRAEYEEAVDEALGTTLGRGREPIVARGATATPQPETKRDLKWRADIVAAKAGGER